MEIIPANNFFEKSVSAFELVVVADNLKTPENMGAVIRLAGNFGALKVIFINTEPINKRKLNKYSSSSSNLVDIVFVEKASELTNHIDDSYVLVGLDTEKNAKNIFNYTFPKKTALFVGNEKHGISEDTLKFISESVFIPMQGIVKSMNVTHALAVGLYEFVKQKM